MNPPQQPGPPQRLSNVLRILALSLAVTTLAPGQAALAQIPAVGEINFYGLRKVTADRILSAAGIRQGQALPASKADAEDTIEKVPGIVLARIEAVCCEGDGAILFVGVEEKGAPHAAFRSAPTGEPVLPQEIVNTYRDFLTAVQHAAARGSAVEDLTAGHSMMADAEPRALQEQFAAYAREHADLLRDVLRTASEPEQRAVAATVIGYVPKKPDIVNDLQYALQDPDDAVRANAIRSLVAIAVLASRQPELGIKISATWFIEMLNSIVLADRLESTKALLTLTDRSAPEVLQQIRERALSALAEMARWKTPRYALPPFILLGRAAALPDIEIQKIWRTGDRESLIKKALPAPARTSRPAKL